MIKIRDKIKIITIDVLVKMKYKIRIPINIFIKKNSIIIQLKKSKLFFVGS